MTQTKVEAPFVENNANFRNLIINGDMHVRQRADTSVHNNGVVKPCDMWQQWASAMDNITGTLAIDSSVPAGYGFSGSLRFDTTTAESALAADEYVALVTHVEAQNAHHLCYGHSDAKATTLSWWSKSNLTGTDEDFVVNIKAPDGSREITKSFYHAAANTWEKFTMAVPGDASGTINDDNGQGFEIKWILSAGSNFTSADSTSWGSVATGGFAYGISANIAASTSNDFYITGVQLEVGDVASDYEYLPYSVQLQRCQRYFQQIPNTASASWQAYPLWGVNANVMSTRLQLPVVMRSNPTGAFVGTRNTDFKVYYNGGYQTLTNEAVADTTDDAVRFDMYSSSAFAANDSGGLYINTTDGRITLAAEL